MALIKCPECNSEISSQAEACPRCGYSLRKSEAKKSGLGCGTGCLAVIVIFIVLAVIGSLSSDNSGSSRSSSSSSSTSSIDLHPEVRFTREQFIIQNNDSFDWTNAKLEINSKTFSSGYTLTVALISAGQIYSVGAMQFAKSDGEKFNPFTHKPLNFTISCDTPRGRGFYYGTWK